MVDRHWVKAWSIAGGAAVAVLGTFLPWLRSGSTDRSSYEMFDLIDRLGFTPGGIVEWAVRLWPLVPLLFVLGVVVQFTMSIHPAAVWARRQTPMAAALYAGGVAGAIRLAPDAGLIAIRYGSWVTVIGSIVVVVATLWPVPTITARATDPEPATRP